MGNPEDAPEPLLAMEVPPERAAKLAEHEHRLQYCRDRFESTGNAIYVHEAVTLMQWPHADECHRVAVPSWIMSYFAGDSRRVIEMAARYGNREVDLLGERNDQRNTADPKGDAPYGMAGAYSEAGNELLKCLGFGDAPKMFRQWAKDFPARMWIGVENQVKAELPAERVKGETRARIWGRDDVGPEERQIDRMKSRVKPR